MPRIMSLTSRIRVILNALIRRGFWYDNVFMTDTRKFNTYSTFNTMIVNLGSTSAWSAFNYQDINIKCANWALRRNSLAGDLAVLKNYSSFLKKDNAIVIISLCPFSSLSGSYEPYEDRYYAFLHPSTIPFFTYAHNIQVQDKIRNPLKHYSFYGFVLDIKHLLPSFKCRKISEDNMNVDALNWIKNWMHEFSLTDLSSPLSLYNKDNVDDGVMYLDAIVDYCKQINAHPVIIVPPMYHSLASKFDAESRKLLFEVFINKMKNKNVQYLNYMDDKQFTNDISLFNNSYLMNERGARLFTKRVLTDLRIV